MLDFVLVSVFVAGALIYLVARLRKKLRALSDPNASAGCSCACDCVKRKFEKKTKN